jgi:hypothetical protein
MRKFSSGDSWTASLKKAWNLRTSDPDSGLNVFFGIPTLMREWSGEAT